MAKRRTVKSVTFLDLKEKREQSGYAFGVLIILSYVLVIVTFPLSLCFCLKVCIIYILDMIESERKNDLIFYLFKVVQEYERAVIFRLGRILADGARGKKTIRNS